MPNVPSKAEFIAIIAMLFATIAFSIDAMLPALPELAARFTPSNVNRAQLVVTSFVLGMGLGTFFTGPLSDAFGRKPVVLAGAALYIVMALAAILAQSLEMLLAARLLQGIGAAGPRVVALAVVRDLHAGRGMARIMSFVMIVLTLVPAIAPTIGAGLILLGGWKAVFVAFAGFAIISATWLALRLPETLAPENRRPFRVRVLIAATREVVTHRVVRLSILAQTLCFGVLFAMISTVQPIYETVFDRAESFPYWFGGIAILSSSSSYLNAVLVMRLGMRRLISTALAVQIGVSGLMVLLMLSGLSGTALFVAFVLWQTSLFFQTGMTLGNLNALGMEPMGHIAGLAASVMGGLSTVGAVIIAVPVGLLFDGTPLPLALGILMMVVAAWAVMRRLGHAETAQPL